MIIMTAGADEAVGFSPDGGHVVIAVQTTPFSAAYPGDRTLGF
ncbi:hypothetical protein LCGC14_2215690 [marine sediment metagenome]|uniref:Uncharacterized protein n=1 Tax=marine sediment metagenome TaxID=412755 RepID=A0A0F9G855_9ZZZZ